MLLLTLKHSRSVCNGMEETSRSDYKSVQHAPYPELDNSEEVPDVEICIDTKTLNEYFHHGKVAL